MTDIVMEHEEKVVQDMEHEEKVVQEYDIRANTGRWKIHERFDYVKVFCFLNVNIFHVCTIYYMYITH